MTTYNSFWDFAQAFSTADACYQHLFDLKWSKGFTCHKCGHTRSCKGRKWHYLKCLNCHYDESSTANTLFHKVKFPIEKAFMITYQLSTMKKGMSTCEIGRQYGIHQETAWFFKRKVQKAMQSANMNRLSAGVEVDETMIGGMEEGRQGRSNGKKKKSKLQ